MLNNTQISRGCMFLFAVVLTSGCKIDHVGAEATSNCKIGMKQYFGINYVEASNEFGYALNKKPAYPGAMIGKALVALARRDADGALGLAEDALKLKPKSHVALYVRAVAKKEKGDAAGAELDLAEAKKIEPKFAPGHLGDMSVFQELRNDVCLVKGW